MSTATWACALVVAAAMSCKSSNGSEAAPGTDARERLLVGTWVPDGGASREYSFTADGSFSMYIDPSKCDDAAAPGKTTMSGKWKLEGEVLDLRVEKSASDIFLGSTMREVVVRHEPQKLVLKSSVVVCGGNGVREQVDLRKR